jgi:hypothetical protein
MKYLKLMSIQAGCEKIPNYNLAGCEKIPNYIAQMTRYHLL